AIPDEFDGEIEAGPTHIADEVVFVLQGTEAVEDFAADPSRVLHQTLLQDRVEHGPGSGDSDGIAAKRVEVAHAGPELGYEFWSHHHARNRIAVAHGLPKGDDVWIDLVAGMS